jgi:HAD superfamily hydrolase (TIGR01509 family)
MGIRGVLWDMDGVLVDTGEFHYQAWSNTLLLHDIPFSRGLFQETFGMNNLGVLSKLLGHDPDLAFQNTISNQKEKKFREIIQGKARPLPGVVETLSFLKSKGIRQAIASSAPQENIDMLVNALNLWDSFDALVSGYTLLGKPAPDIFLASAQALGIPPQNCLVIEDAVTGVEGAKQAGMLCLAVTNTNPAEKLNQADYIVDSLLQIEPGFLEKILGNAPEYLE